MTQSFEERRRTERITTRILVEIRVPDWQVLQQVYTINLSLGGMRVSMGRRPLMGAEVDVILTLPNGQRLHLPGRVAHLGPTGTDDVGIRFDDLQPQTRDEIDAFIRTLSAATPVTESHSGGIPSGTLIRKKT
ncbi:MAG TPA: PilZ domain-containing protein [Polyangia bacterium]|nr:PilZ domain-containing protein [Polyangia bacterium]